MTERKKYSKAPLVEAVCEFRLPPDSDWDITIPGLLYEQIRSMYPHKDLVKGHQVRVLPRGPDAIASEVVPTETIRFLTDDRKDMVRIDNRLVAASRFAPYKSWEDYRKSIELVFNELKKVSDFSHLLRIGLRYINRIEIPGRKLELEDYFNFRPQQDGDLGDFDFSGFYVGVEIPFEDGRDVCRIQFTNTPAEQPNKVAFMLDLDYFLLKPKGVKRDTTLAWVETAHNGIEKVFEGCLTDKLRGKLGVKR